MTQPEPIRTAASTADPVLLVGAGPSHRQLLRQLARRPEPGRRILLLHPATHGTDPAHLAAFVAGPGHPPFAAVELRPLVDAAGVTWQPDRVRALETEARRLLLDDGEALPYAQLSIDLGPVQERAALEQQLPGAREHGLFLWPAERFVSLWPQVLALGPARLRSLAVIGPGRTAMALALALRQHLPQAAVTWVTGGAQAGAGLPAAVARCITAELARRAVTVLPDHATRLATGEVQLGCGGRLACDVPLLALESGPPAWLAESGLARDAQGGPVLDGARRCGGLPDVLLAPEAEAPPGLHARHARNLRRAIAGAPLQNLPTPAAWRLWLRCGDGAAIVGGPHWALRSRWLGRWLRGPA